MDRLTTVLGDKVYYSKGKYGKTTLCAEMENWEVRECMKKLAEYEDKELIPTTKQTNFDKIKSMTVEEIAEFIKNMIDEDEIHGIGCYQCIYYGTHHTDKSNIGTEHEYLYECKNCENEGIGLDTKKWLKSEVIE